MDKSQKKEKAGQGASRRLLAVPAGDPASLGMVYPAEVRAVLDEQVEWLRPFPEAGEGRPDWREWPKETECLFSTWGMPQLTPALLDALPNLRAVFYGAGSVKRFVTEESYARGVRIFSGATANAIPVAEFALGQILLGLKRYRQLEAGTAEEWVACCKRRNAVPGNFRTRVGLVSYGTIARLLRGYLRPFDHRVAVWDPFLTAEAAEAEGVELMTREGLFRECDVVSIHTPLLPETKGMFGRDDIRLLKEGALLINTARGALFDADGFAAGLRERPDVRAVVDVIGAEPPQAEHPLFGLENVEITPHIAGSMGPECARIGFYMVDALASVMENRASEREVFESDLGAIA